MKNVVNMHISHIKEAKTYYPMSAHLPSFTLFESAFEASMKDVIFEKLSDGLNNQHYGSGIFDASATDFILVEKKKSANMRLTMKEEQMDAYMNSVLPGLLKDDKNFSQIEVSRSAFYKAISDRVSDSFTGLSFKDLIKDSMPSVISKEINDETNKLTASLIILQKQFPLVYNQMLPKLRENDRFITIEQTMHNPNMDIVSLVQEFSPDTANAKFALHLTNSKKSENRLSPQ